MNCSDYIGRRFGKLVVVERAENTKNGASQWLCCCDCGNTVIVPQYSLKRRGVNQDCGCIKKEHFNTTHGGSNTPLYQLWNSMKRRCEDVNSFAYKDYGGRGITVCDEWHDFVAFQKWATETRPDKFYTLDRIDNNKGYSPQNCKWSSKKEQANNRRSNVKIEFRGEVHNLVEWCEILNLDYKRIHNRMHKLGWSFEKAIAVPVDAKKRNRKERKEI